MQAWPRPLFWFVICLLYHASRQVSTRQMQSPTLRRRAIPRKWKQWPSWRKRRESTFSSLPIPIENRHLPMLLSPISVAIKCVSVLLVCLDYQLFILPHSRQTVWWLGWVKAQMLLFLSVLWWKWLLLSAHSKSYHQCPAVSGGSVLNFFSLADQGTLSLFPSTRTCCWMWTSISAREQHWWSGWTTFSAKLVTSDPQLSMGLIDVEPPSNHLKVEERSIHSVWKYLGRGFHEQVAVSRNPRRQVGFVWNFLVT